MTICNGEGIKNTRKEIYSYIREEEEIFIPGGDWNAKIGKKGEFIHERGI